MLIVLALHFVVALLAPLLFRRLGRSTFYLLAAVPAGSFIWLLTRYGPVMDAAPAALPGTAGAGPAAVIAWVPDLKLELAFRMDALSWILELLVLGVGALVLFYCARYFKADDPHLGPFGAQLLAFAGVMFGLITADDMILLFIFWELTTILSYLLIGYARSRLAARRAALQALLVTTMGGLAMLVGVIILGQCAGTYRLSAVVARGPELIAQHPVLGNAAVVLLLVGALTKSALLPFHFWLPAAMAAPTPVSAYLHAAAMVKAGIYLIARFAPGFAEAGAWQPLIIVLGLSTMLVGGWRALRQPDLKLILAYGTVSQLGFMSLVVGLGSADAALAGLALLLAHGLFKATLFLVVGIIDHTTGTRDITRLSGVFRSAPVLAVIALIAAASMAGIPPLGGFVAKEAVYGVFLDRADGPGSIVLAAGVVLGSVLTFAYSARFIWGGFARKPGAADTVFPRVRWEFLAAPAVLTIATIAYGAAPGPVGAWIGRYAALFPASPAALPGAAHGAVPALALWHGFTAPLALSALTVGAGLALFYWRTAVSRFQGRLSPFLGVFNAERGYRHTITGLDEAAVWVTGRIQRGSLLFYLSVILVVATAFPAAAAIFGDGPMPRHWTIFDTPAQAVTGLVIIAAALAALRAEKRFPAVLMVSVAGYGISLIFALQGAPDLALTQMLVETIVLVAFVLALRSLPARVWQRARGRLRLWRALIGISFGTAMVFIAMTAMASRTALPVSLAFPQLAYDDGGGANIVNVTLVDIRAWDTFGEISVLAAAATGLASLIFVLGRGDKRIRAQEAAAGTVGRRLDPLSARGREAASAEVARRFVNDARGAWLVAGRTLAPERRSIIFEVVTRLLFHTMIVYSVYLLLAGHNSPGGGFAGGLMAGLALTMRYLAGGRFELAEATPLSAGRLLGIGLGTAALSGLAPLLLLGGATFGSAIIEFALPVIGDVKFVTSTIFDIGVYLVVVGLTLDVLRSLGSEIDERVESAVAATRRPNAPAVGTSSGAGR